MMFYFDLQRRLLVRRIIDFGLPPSIGVALGILVFTGFSLLLFRQVAYAEYIYLLFAAYYIAPLSNKDRNDLLRVVHSRQAYRKVRVVENMLVAAPFSGWLVVFENYGITVLLLIAATSLAYISTDQGLNRTIPTPFGGRPWEFCTGFRRTLLAVLVVYLLVGIAICARNGNLAVFAQLLLFFLCFSFYNFIELGIYVWMHSETSAAFLRDKIAIGTWYCSLLTLPMFVVILICFPSLWRAVVVIQLFGYALLSMQILAKYSVYPRQISLPQATVMAIGIMLPPFLLAIIPYFWTRATSNLKSILR